ncbi:MAG TPA: hypothetical protein VME66_09125 [Candidatus Acidoferrales bacterium]|nr:hypothetical protein [Candidatus Acidoferrales bacterium]
MTDRPRPPQFPYDQMQSHVQDDPQASQSLDALRSATTQPEAERSHVEQHLGILRGVPAVVPILENWYEQPATQAWLKTLSDIGL